MTGDELTPEAVKNITDALNTSSLFGIHDFSLDDAVWPSWLEAVGVNTNGNPWISIKDLLPLREEAVYQSLAEGSGGVLSPESIALMDPPTRIYWSQLISAIVEQENGTSFSWEDYPEDDND